MKIAFHSVSSEVPDSSDLKTPSETTTGVAIEGIDESLVEHIIDGQAKLESLKCPVLRRPGCEEVMGYVSGEPILTETRAFVV